MKKFILIAICFLTSFLAQNSFADEFYLTGPTTYTYDGGFGHLEKITGRYNNINMQLELAFEFSPDPSTGKLPQGLFFVLNDGPNPKSMDTGKYVGYYFDATNLNDLKLTVYAHNTRMARNDWQFGTGADVPPDPIQSSLLSGAWIYYKNVSDTVVNGATRRTFSMMIEGTQINSHVPLYPSTTYFGTGFGCQWGMWLGWFADLTTAYALNSSAPYPSIPGYLTKWDYPGSWTGGYFDTAGVQGVDCQGNPRYIGACGQCNCAAPRNDECGVCGGDNTTCAGCDGVPNSGKVLDQCDVCGGSNACLDCAGVPNGGHTVDLCGVCGGTNACVDCSGTANGGKVVDTCGVCGGDGSSCRATPTPVPACVPFDNTASIRAMDARSQDALKFTIDALNAAKKTKGASKATKNSAKSLEVTVRALQSKAWISANSFKESGITCPGTRADCTSVNASTLLASYISTAADLQKYSESALKLLQRASKDKKIAAKNKKTAATLRAKISTAFSAEITATKSLVTVSSTCR